MVKGKLHEKLVKLGIPALYSTEGKPESERVIYAKCFALASGATWLISEYNPEEKLAFGYTDLFGTGSQGGACWGYISIEELEELVWINIPRVEFDRYFSKKLFTKCIDDEGRIRC